VKFAVNQTSYMLILMSGKIKLYPMGSPGNRDRFLIQDRWLAHPDIVKFEKLGKIKLVSAEELQSLALPQAGKAATAAPPEPSSPPPSPIVEDKPAVQAEPETEQAEPQQGRRRRRRN
jgi:hypothetical protein